MKLPAEQSKRDSANREQDYCATLIKLFDLYYAAGNYLKAADSLDAAAEVDAYETGHQKRLEMLDDHLRALTRPRGEARDRAPDVERKLDELLREVRELRRELKK